MTEKPQSSIAEMIDSITSEFSALVRGHIDLAKAEITESVRNGLKSSALFLIAFTFGFFAIIMLLISAGYGLVAAGLPAWLAFLMLALAIVLLAALSLATAIARMKKVRGPVKTFASLTETSKSIRIHLDDK